jgi:SAM-dependent methyltransferase
MSHAPPEVFDRTARRCQRDRSAPIHATADFVRAAMVDGLVERLASVRRAFTEMLDLGCFGGSFPVPAGAHVARLDPGFRFARAAGGVQADEDRLPFADGAFDLVVAAGTLDTVNDLPGALALVRRVLRPDGLFLGAFLGAGSLATLRECLREAESARPVARLHPQIDVRSAGDLLVRAGFALPVADGETVTARYGDLFALLRDLRAMPAGNVLADRHPLSRSALLRAAEAFAARADADGRVRERFAIVTVTGWAPAPDQPRPARRGSAGASLAAALRDRSDGPR